ncbi:MAG TPA: ABC transporter substrate-binding protein [Casimicrobiaceae bacterium]|nr:ABC transporter substrate-binding protein [Casimicrobiaceae bacterium]
MVRKRLLIAGMIVLGAAACATRVTAQPSVKLHRIGVLTVGDIAPLRRSLAELGYVEGRNVAFEVRNTEGKEDRLDAIAADLARSDVSVIVAAYPAVAIAAKRATAKIPIVMVNTPDPVQLGLVASLASPGGNITGTTSLSIDVSLKQLEILKEAVTGASRIAVLWNPDNPWHASVVRALTSENRLPGVRLQVVPARSLTEFESAFGAMAQEHADAVLVLADPVLSGSSNRFRVAQLALARRLPSMGGLRSFTEAGGMMSYWANEDELYARVASYIDRIFKGANPGALPIEQPTKWDLIVNQKTAAALGRVLPPALLLRATVIQ